MIDVSKFVQTLEGKPVAVFGLGISNIAVIKALVKADVGVTAWDDNEANRATGEKAGATLKDLTQESAADYGCLVLAPGVNLKYPSPHPVVMWAQAAGLETLCDLEILHRCDHGRLTIGITGTNGKSTTTALIGHVLGECGIKVAIGGNIGKAALDLVLPPKDGVFVLEVSSFQLDLCPSFTPDIAVLLNISADHLDRHGSMDEYAAAKQKLFRGIGKAVIGVDDDWSGQILDRVEGEGERDCFPVSACRDVDGGVYVDNRTLYDGIYAEAYPVFDLDIGTLPGVHNHQNAAVAYTVARLRDVAPDAIYEAMKSFPGLPYRQFQERVINGVAYINDSKATNAAATARALACYNNIYWILGGVRKADGLNGLEPYVGQIRHAFLIGDAAEDFAVWLDNHGVPHNFSETLDRAVLKAHQLAQSERGQPGGTGTVLFSPACSSFDQFKNFEERGKSFTDIVNALKEVSA